MVHESPSNASLRLLEARASEGNHVKVLQEGSKFNIQKISEHEEKQEATPQKTEGFGENEI